MFNNIILITIFYHLGPDFCKKSGLSTPSHLTVTAPVGHAAALRCAGTFTASVSLPGALLTFRCGPEGPC